MNSRTLGVSAAVATLLFMTAVRQTGADDRQQSLLPPTIGGITLGDSPSKVRSRLGEPTIRVTEDHTEYRYDGLLLYMDEGSVSLIIATGKSFCTPTGICPGTPQTEVFRRLGKPIRSDSVQEGYNSYGVDAEACWMRVDVHSGYVSKLAILCQP